MESGTPNRDDCVIPHAVEPEALNKYHLKRDRFDGADEIGAYVEGQSREERVTYLEKISTECVWGREHATWDVHTTGERYWVITNPTNLYSQRLFPSADYTLSFHVGLMARVFARQERAADEEHADRLAAPWRRWSDAALALDGAKEPEDYQAVGMRCRECLLTLVRDARRDSMVPPGMERPKTGDFNGWADIIAGAIAAGGDNKELRGYLKSLAREMWHLAGWLTHERGATRFDGELVLDATRATLSAFTVALLRDEKGGAECCPRCSSYKLARRFIEPPGMDGGDATVCEACGWTDVPAIADALVEDELDHERWRNGLRAGDGKETI